MSALVSIVMPAYNAERHIAEAVRSVLAQTWPDWELVIVDDGSIDGTASVLAGLSDPRILVVRQANAGVSAARNTALGLVRGKYLCFLDADDVLPPKSLRARLAVFEEHPGTDAVDGRVELVDAASGRTLRMWSPTFTGEPFLELVRLTGSCFCGNTWMMRWSPTERVRFRPGLTHGEDLLFYLEYAPDRSYRYTDEVVLRYRRAEGSSMSDLAGLERSYYSILRWMRERPHVVPPEERRVFRRRIRRIMVGSYWHAGRPFRAFRSLLRGSFGEELREDASISGAQVLR